MQSIQIQILPLHFQQRRVAKIEQNRCPGPLNKESVNLPMLFHNHPPYSGQGLRSCSENDVVDVAAERAGLAQHIKDLCEANNKSGP
eukprot:39331-Eustigmatos_ZCMA.PRE.1